MARRVFSHAFEKLYEFDAVGDCRLLCLTSALSGKQHLPRSGFVMLRVRDEQSGSPANIMAGAGLFFRRRFCRLLGFIQLVISWQWPGNPAEIVFKVMAGILAFCVAIYTGFVLKAVKGVPFWNSWLLPVLFIMCGVLGGFGLSVAIALSGGDIDAFPGGNGQPYAAGH